ncbi:MAG: hypothetical protein SNJ65_19910, partial [Roseiflexus sp.]
MPYLRNWIACAVLIGALIGCGQTIPLSTQPTTTPVSPAHATAAVVLTSVAEGGEVRIEPEAAGQIPGITTTPEPVARAPVTAHVAAAEQTVRSYFTAFGERRAADAWALLAPPMQANM